MQVQFSLNLGADFHLGRSALVQLPAPEIVEAIPVAAVGFVENDRDGGQDRPDRAHDAEIRSRLLEQRAARQNQRRLGNGKKESRPSNHRHESAIPVITTAQIGTAGGLLTFAFTAGLELGLTPVLDVTV